MSILKMDGYDDCVLGILERFGGQQYLVYDKDKVINKMVKDGMSYEDAIEYYEYNMIGAWVGEQTVGFVTLKDPSISLDSFIEEEDPE